MVELAHLIPRIQDLNDENLGTSAQVTVIRGGDKINIIPSHARASVDVRILDPKESQRVEAFFARLSQKRLFEQSAIQVSGKIDRSPMAITPQSLAIQELIMAQAKKMGIDMGAITTGDVPTAT